MYGLIGLVKLNLRSLLASGLLVVYSVMFYMPIGPVFASATCGGTITVSVTLSGDMLCSGNGLTFGSDEITLDCAGHMITGSEVGTGINITGRTGVIAKNCNVSSFLVDFLLSSSSFSSLTANTALGKGFGFELLGSSSNNLTGNSAHSTRSYYDGFYLSMSSSNSIDGNIATGYTEGFNLGSLSSNNTLTANTGNTNFNGFDLYSGSSNLLVGNIANNNTFDGFDVAYSSSNTLTANTAINDSRGGDFRSAGFHLFSSSSNDTLRANLASGNNAGFDLDGSFNTLMANIANNNSGTGFSFNGSSNLLTANTANNDGSGFNLYSSSSNVLIANTASNNSGDGFALSTNYDPLTGKIIPSAYNVLRGNTADNNGAGFTTEVAGFGIIGANNTLTGNTATKNRFSGFDVCCSFNTLMGNTANSNHGDIYNGDKGTGFSLSGSSNVLAGNTANSNTANGFALGFRCCNSSNNSITGNVASGNGDDGFLLSTSFGGSKNTISVNSADANGGFGYLDSSAGSGTQKTANIYSENTCNDNGAGPSSPLGLCKGSIHVSGFFTGPSLNPLPPDQLGNGVVSVALAGSTVRSTDPEPVLAWMNITNTSDSPLGSLRLNETLPSDWAVTPSWMPSVLAIQVIYANGTSLANEVGITEPSTITVSTGNPETVTVVISNFTATRIGHALMPGQSILLAVDLAYSLVGSTQPASSYPRAYDDTANATAWTRASFTGAEFSGGSSALLSAYAKTLPWDFDVKTTTPAPVGVDEPAASTISVTGLYGFADQVILSVSPAPGIFCGAMKPSNIIPSETATISCVGTIAGSYPVTVTGTSGSTIRSATFTITVNSLPTPVALQPTIFGLAPSLFYSLIGIAAIVAVAITVTLLQRRRTMTRNVVRQAND